MEQFGSEDKCHAYLEAMRWPNGVVCPRCGSDAISRIHKRRQYHCDGPVEGPVLKGRKRLSCGYQFSVRVGTIFDRSHLPLWKWFLAIYLVGESKKGISAKQLERLLSVSYKTAWFLGHRIRAAMEEDSPVALRGIVEIDETYVGGKPRPGAPKRGPWDNKVMVLGAIQRGGDIRLKVEERHTGQALRDFAKATTHDETTAIYTDSAAGYRGIGDHNTRHESVNHHKEEWVRGNVHTNNVEGVWSLLKRSVVGTYHQLSAKHLPAYLDEISFRFNNRENPWLFRDTVLRLIGEEPLRYETLVHG